jgi:hypothetical protein
MTRRNLFGLSVAAGLTSLTPGVLAQQPECLAQVALAAGPAHGVIMDLGLNTNELTTISLEAFAADLNHLQQLGLITQPESAQLTQAFQLAAAIDVTLGVTFPPNSRIPTLVLNLFPTRADRSGLLTSPTALLAQLNNIYQSLAGSNPRQPAGSPMAIALAGIALNSAQQSIALFAKSGKTKKVVSADLKGAGTGGAAGAAVGAATGAGALLLGILGAIGGAVVASLEAS